MEMGKVECEKIAFALGIFGPEYLTFKHIYNFKLKIVFCNPKFKTAGSDEDNTDIRFRE